MPSCLVPILIEGNFKDAASTIPLDELPIIKFECLNKLIYKFNPQFLISKNLKHNNNKISNLFSNLKQTNPGLLFQDLGNRKNTEKNYAFFIISQMEKKNIKQIRNVLIKNSINFSHIANKDGHNYNGWMKFMLKNKIPFKNLCSIETENILNTTFFIEVNSLLK